MTKPVILFVDDEASVLQGLRRSLFGKRTDWDMQFVGGGAEALELMSQIPVHVIVTDMRMPGMDGAQLLESVARKFPDTVRFVLSGQADDEAIFRAVGPSHQFFSKPASTALIVEKVERSLALRRFLTQPEIRAGLTGLKMIPPASDIYVELIRELKQSKILDERIDHIVERDPAIVAKILQVANSAYFAPAQTINSVHQAAKRLGFDIVKALVLLCGALNQFRGANIGGVTTDQIAIHSLHVGAVARRIARLEGLDVQTVDAAYVAGLLHDIGLLALGVNMSAAYGDIVDQAVRDATPLEFVEMSRLGFTHAPVGAYLLATWGISDPIVEAVAYHHSSDLISGRSIDVAVAVWAANRLTSTALTSAKSEPADLPVDAVK